MMVEVIMGAVIASLVLVILAILGIVGTWVALIVSAVTLGLILIYLLTHDLRTYHGT